MEIFPVIQKVLQAYHDDVVGRQYPGPEHTVFMKEEELKRFRDMVNWH
jgi:3-methyl-2-oxobutanoate hydroxymethyltransferase